jgi:hypothetical protein
MLGACKSPSRLAIFTDVLRYGKDDQLGFLNRLTDEIVVNAAKEIKSGARLVTSIADRDNSRSRISLNLPMEAKVVLFGRQPFELDVYQKAPRIVNDDVWTLNTQSSSQCKNAFVVSFLTWSRGRFTSLWLPETRQILQWSNSG